MKEIVQNGDRLYAVIRRFKHSTLDRKDGTLNAEGALALRDFLGADHVLKTQTHYVYCQNVDEPQWEPITNQKNHGN